MRLHASTHYNLIQKKKGMTRVRTRSGLVKIKSGPGKINQVR